MKDLCLCIFVYKYSYFASRRFHYNYLWLCVVEMTQASTIDYHFGSFTNLLASTSQYIYIYMYIFLVSQNRYNNSINIHLCTIQATVYVVVFNPSQTPLTSHLPKDEWRIIYIKISLSFSTPTHLLL